MDTEQREGTVMLIKAIIGAAALVFPRCYQRAGIIPATAALIIAGWAGVIVGDLLMETRRALGRKVSTFRDMGVAAAGNSPWGGVVLDATVTLQSFGTLVGYVVAVGDLVASSLRRDWGVPDLVEVPQPILSLLSSIPLVTPRQYITARSFSLIVLTLFLFFPLCLLRRLESLRALTASTMIIYGFFLLVLLKESTVRVFTGDLHLFEGEDVPSAPLNWMGDGFFNIFRVLPIIALSYSCVPLMIEVRRTLERKIASKSQLETSWHVVAVASFAASGFFYIMTGLLGYVAFRGTTHANVLSNLEGLGWIAGLVNMLFALSLIISYPLICFVVREPVRRILLSLLAYAGGGIGYSDDVEKVLTSPKPGDIERSQQSSDDSCRTVHTDANSPAFIIFAMEAAIVTSATLGVAIAFPGIDVVLELIGGTAAVFVSYIAPAGLFLIVKPDSFKKYRVRAFVIGWAGVVIGFLTCYNLYISLSTEHAKTALLPPKQPPVSEQ